MNDQKEWYADLILPLALPKLYTYRLPAEFLDFAQKGKRAIVQFGKQKIYSALISDIHLNKPKHYDTKDILKIFDDTPVVNDIQLRLWQWISEYYCCTLGEVMKAALPAGLKLNSETKIISNNEFSDYHLLTSEEKLILDILNNNKILTINDLSSILKKTNILDTIKELTTKEALFIEEKLIEKYKPKTIKYISLNPELANESELNKVMDSLCKAPVQLNILMAYISLSGYFSGKAKPIQKRIILDKCDTNSTNLLPLIKKKILIETEMEESRIHNEYLNSHEAVKLNDFQKQTFDQINELFKTKPVVLLHGVTSSGKTEIYIHLIKETLANNKSVLYLVPEIALTAQIIQKLTRHFGQHVGIYHSKYSDAERYELWNDLLKKEHATCKIILGVRSSVFLPFDNLGLIIVDEEHENTYKQFDPAPRYHARDSAIMLAEMHQAKVLLGTATPSLESYFNASSGKYGLAILDKRYKDIQLPEIQVIDRVNSMKKKRMHSHFSQDLLDAMENALKYKEQIILFQNRRGYSPYIECQTCGWVPYCIHCDVSLTYHKYHNRLNCHYCGHSVKIISTCSACGSNSLVTKGFGTEKIEDEIKIFFPKAKIARMDMDTTRTRKAYFSVIEQFETGKVDILVGTQMLSKGLNFDNVSLVGIINADNMLNYPDFRAHERSFQLMEQVSGRAGRKFKQGKVIIQTASPENYVIKNVVNHNYIAHYNTLINERYQFKYPPYYKLIKIILKDRQQQKVEDCSVMLGELLKSIPKIVIIGPEAPIVGKIFTWYLRHIYIKLPRTKDYAILKQKIIQKTSQAEASEQYKSVKIILDIDPM